MPIVYQHLRKDTREVFYIGIGKDEKRAFDKYKRSNFWYNIVHKYQYIVDILCRNVSWEEACKIERFLISFYGRVDNKTGILVNHTDGGEGVLGYKHSEETKTKKFKKYQKFNLFRTN